jgi:Protein of unknown function (DUF3800)
MAVAAAQYGDFIAYVDEAGDHGPVSTEFPVFILAFCVFRKEEYARATLPAFSQFKFKYFGHDAIVLHEREIRKQTAPFQILRDASIRAPFFDDLNELIQEAPFTLIAVAVDKRARSVDDNPYDIALDAGLVQVTKYLRQCGESRLTHVVVESRGKKEDGELREAFDRFCLPSGTLDGCNLDLVFASKAHSHSGMQLADMVARPIGRHVMAPAQPNRAYEILSRKFWEAPSPLGRGLQIFAEPTSK